MRNKLKNLGPEDVDELVLTYSRNTQGYRYLNELSVDELWVP